MAGPLDGVRIIEVGEVISAPLAVMMLAEQGADVIKVEPPGHGEESRQLSNYRAGMAGLYANCNHGKRSIGIDLKTPEGLELLYQLSGAPTSSSRIGAPALPNACASPSRICAASTTGSSTPRSRATATGAPMPGAGATTRSSRR